MNNLDNIKITSEDHISRTNEQVEASKDLIKETEKIIKSTRNTLRDEER